MTGLTGSACGKVILLGEHAVVYGVPAIAVGIERGVHAVAKPSTSARSTLTVRSWGTEVDENDGRDLGRALGALVRVTPLAAPLDIEAFVDLPPGGGLGCSAALGVAVARAMDPHASPEVLVDRVAVWEKVFHGNPSGIDAAVSSRGGCVFYSKGAGITEVGVHSTLAMCVGYSGESSSTAAMVESVARRKRDFTPAVQGAFDGIHSLVMGARVAIEAGDRRTLGRLMDLNQMWLADLGVSTPALDRMCLLARDHGALGAKLTGAGGGGCVVALVGSGRGAWQVLDAWRGAGFEGFVTRVAPTHAPVSSERPLMHAGKD